jgi:hypothetical protein
VGPRCWGGSAEEEGRTGRLENEGRSSSMVDLAGKEEEKMGKRLNEHGFVKRDTRRRRGHRYQPRGGDSFRRDAGDGRKCSPEVRG